MKRLSFLVACIVFASSSCAFADTFDFSPGLLANVRREISGSALVRTGTQSISDICRVRRRLLGNIIRGKREGNVAQAINSYMQSARMHPGDFDVVQLRRSENFAQLEHNVKSLVRTYGVILSEDGRGSGARSDAETAASKGSSVSSSKKHTGSRPNRQNKTQNGRSYRK